MNVKNFAVEIFSLYTQAPLPRENIVREISPCFKRMTVLLAVDSLWAFTVTSSQLAEMLYQTPRDHSLQQAGTRSGDRESLEEEGQLRSL